MQMGLLQIQLFRIIDFILEKLLTFSCHWNYRPDHCMYMQVCKSSNEHGVKILHGCRRAFHVEKWPTFKAIYNAIKSFDLDNELHTLLRVMYSFILLS